MIDRIDDVCVIGSGPAGMTVARQLASLDPRTTICILESGQAMPTTFSDDLRDVDSRGIKIKTCSRERVLGGSSSTWSGLCARFDDIDLSDRSWVSNSHWPISGATLLQYYERAAERYRLPAPSSFSPSSWEEVLDDGGIKPNWTLLETKMFVALTPPQRFGVENLDFIDGTRVRLLLDSSVVRLEGNPATNTVTHAVVRNSEGRESFVGARIFVVACGGIENARLLLVSRFGCPNGLGNERDRVGRYLMNHPKGSYGEVVLAQPLMQLRPLLGGIYKGLFCFAGLRLKESYQVRDGLLNSYLRLRPPSDRPLGAAERVIRFLLGRVRSHFKPHSCKGAPVADQIRDQEQVEMELAASTMPSVRRSAVEVRVIRRLLTSVLGTSARTASPGSALIVRNFMEMEPHPANRVTLGSRTDAFNTPLPVVTHAPTPLDKESICALHRALRFELERSGCGTLHSDLTPDLNPWPIATDSSHHMGTTRMGSCEAASVVDENCRVHSSPNVYIAGSSVFPTSGNANPTYTIVALAIRLADHLKDRLNEW